MSIKEITSKKSHQRNDCPGIRRPQAITVLFSNRYPLAPASLPLGEQGGIVSISVALSPLGERVDRERRYSPAVCVGATAAVITGRPERRHISTSYVERANLTMRMWMRRFTRLTNGFSKKVENLRHAVALYAVHYNFCRIHQTLRVTPAMEAGLATRVWDVSDIVRLVSSESFVAA